MSQRASIDEQGTASDGDNECCRKVQLSSLAAGAFNAPGYSQANYVDVKAKLTSQLRSSTGNGYHVRTSLTLCLLHSWKLGINTNGSPHNPLPLPNNLSDTFLGLCPIPSLSKLSCPPWNPYYSQIITLNISFSSFPAAISSNTTGGSTPR
jgi:hypothetical protein